jgi:hypothetical protein
MLSLKLSYFRLLLGQACARIFQLTRDEVGGVLRLLLHYFLILVDEQVSQFAGNLLGNMRIPRRITDLKAVIWSP